MVIIVRHCLMMSIFYPRNISWARKRHVRYWCAGWNRKNRGQRQGWRACRNAGACFCHLAGDESFFCFARCAKSLHVLPWPPPTCKSANSSSSIPARPITRDGIEQLTEILSDGTVSIGSSILDNTNLTSLTHWSCSLLVQTASVSVKYPMRAFA